MADHDDPRTAHEAGEPNDEVRDEARAESAVGDIGAEHGVENEAADQATEPVAEITETEPATELVQVAEQATEPVAEIAEPEPATVVVAAAEADPATEVVQAAESESESVTEVVQAAEPVTEPAPQLPPPAVPQPPLVPPQPVFHPQQQQPQQPQPSYAPGYPQPGAYPAGTYPGTAGPQGSARPPLVTAADLLSAVRDGLIGVGAAYLTAIVGLLLVIAVGFGYAHVNASFGDYLATAAWLTASSLGTPITGSVSASMDFSGDTSTDSLFNSSGSDLSMSIGTSARVSVWLLTIIVLFLVFRAARRRERTLPSTSLGQLVARAGLPAAVVSVTLLILALATHRSDPFGLADLAGAGSLGADTSFSMGIDTPLVFVGPLLLVFAAGLLARIGVWMHSGTADPRALRLRTQQSRWRPAFRVAWLQTWVIGTLVGIGIWVYGAYEVISQGSLSHGGLAALIGALFLLPNLAVYGTFLGYGVSLYATAAGLGALSSGLASGDGSDSSDPGSGGGYDIGLFTSHRPWGLWLLLLAVVIGTAAPAILARRGGRLFAVDREDYVPNGVWRSVVIGLAGALVVTLLGALEMSMNAGMGAGGGSFGGFSMTESFGPSLIAALGLAALWFLLSYLVLSLSMGHRIQVATMAGAGAGAGAATVPGQYGPYGQVQQPYEYQQQYQQAYPAQGTVPTAMSVSETVGTAAEFNEGAAPVTTEAAGLAQSPTTPFGPSAETAGTPATPFGPPTGPTQPQFGPYQQPGPPQEFPQGFPQQGYPPQYAQWPGQPAPTQPTAMRRGVQRKVVIPVVIVLILAVGGFITYHYVAGDSQSGPEAAVSSYFDSLQSGDAAAAAALAIGPYPESEEPITDAKTLADAANRPSGLTIVSSKAATASQVQQLRESDVTGNTPTFVVVKYTVHGSKLTDTYLVTQNTKTSKWQLVDPYEDLSVSGGWSSKVTVDGVSFDESDTVLVFPGGHVVADPASADFTSSSKTVYPTDDSSDDDSANSDEATDGTDEGWDFIVATLPEVELPDATLTDKGQAAAQAAYKDALDQCAEDAETGYGECGIDDTYDYYDTNSVTWTITTVGTVDVDLSEQNSDGSFDFTASGSEASESGDYTDWDGSDVKFSDETVDLDDSEGTITFDDDGTATVSLY